MIREHNDVLVARYEDYFLEPAPVVIGHLKTAMLNECRRVIDATPFGEEMTPEYASIMRAMTGWHYERIRHLYNPKHATDRRYLEVLQDNGEWISHSWNKAISPKSVIYLTMPKKSNGVFMVNPLTLFSKRIISTRPILDKTAC